MIIIIIIIIIICFRARLGSATLNLYPCSLDQTLASTIGTCRLATSRYLPSLAEATMYVQSALLLENVFQDGWTLRLGDGAEELTPGVATKREESPLPIRATQGGTGLQGCLRRPRVFLKKNHRSRTRLDLALCRGI